MIDRSAGKAIEPVDHVLGRGDSEVGGSAVASEAAIIADLLRDGDGAATQAGVHAEIERVGPDGAVEDRATIAGDLLVAEADFA